LNMEPSGQWNPVALRWVCELGEAMNSDRL
jgi:hypothetical protein